MKKLIALCACGLSMLSAAALTFNVKVGDVTYSAPADKCGDMTYTDGRTLTFLGKEFALADIDGMAVDNSEVAENTVAVTYSGTSASVVVDARIAQYVDITVDAAKVTVAQHDDVSTEITYTLQGSSQQGAFAMTGSFKATVELNGLTLTNPDGAPIDIQNGKRIKLKVIEDTANSLTDGAGGSQKGCLVCKGHLEIAGKGSLTVAANTAHGIYAKEYITLKNSKITVTSAVKDGLNCNQYFEMNSGSLSISGVGDDGIQVSFKDDTDREAEDTGTVTVAGGTLNVAATATAAKAIKADGDIVITGGDITASVSGGGKWDSTASKTKAAACLGADGNMTISGGTLNLTATGSGGKGINVDGTLTISGGDINIKTSGGIYAYVNGREYDNYTGNTDSLDSDAKSSPKGVKVDGNITISDGTITVNTTGRGSEGIESKSELTIEGGTIVINSYDDCINSSSHMYIKGGDITAVSSNNDGLDSNGNLYMQGGYVRAFGASSPECGIDANEEQGFTVIFTGGTLLAVGGGNSTPTKSTSTQAYVSGTLSLTAGSTLTLKSGSTALATFEVPAGYKSSGSGGGFGPGGGNRGGSVLITCPGLANGSSYTMAAGSTSTSVTARLTGSGSGRPW